MYAWQVRTERGKENSFYKPLKCEKYCFTEIDVRSVARKDSNGTCINKRGRASLGPAPATTTTGTYTTLSVGIEARV